MGLIRPATTQDASSLAALGLEVWLSTYIKHGVTAQFADYALAHFTPARFAGWIADPNHKLWVSQNDAGIDGYSHLDLKASDPVVGQISTELVSLYVQPRHQGRGLGRALLDAAAAHRPLWLAVNTQNAPAQKFYAAQSFSKIGETAFQIGDDSYPNDILLAR